MRWLVHLESAFWNPAGDHTMPWALPLCLAGWAAQTRHPTHDHPPGIPVVPSRKECRDYADIVGRFLTLVAKLIDEAAMQAEVDPAAAGQG
jgi:hypothetical protein